MIDFSELTLAGAQAYRDAYVASLPSRHEWLAAELRATGLDPAVLATPDGLPALWTHVEAIVERDGAWTLRTAQPAADRQQGGRPPWYDPTVSLSIAPFADGTLWMIELLGAHVARLVIEAAPGCSWGIYRAPKRLRDVNQHRTVLLDVPSGPHADPSGIVYGVLLTRFHYRRPSFSGADSLDDVYRFLVTPRSP